MKVNYHGSPIVAEHPPRRTEIAAGDHFPFIADEDVQKRIADCWSSGHTTLTVVAAHGVAAPWPTTSPLVAQ